MGILNPFVPLCLCASVPDETTAPAGHIPGPGLVQVYTGNGKGKTTAALGLALRAWGRGVRVCLIQFFKTRETGELLANRKCGLFDHYSAGRGFVIGDPTVEDVAAAVRGLETAARILSAGEHQLVILDEINNAVAKGLLSAADVLAAVAGRHHGVEVVLTGRDAPSEFIQAADLVTVMEPLKHPMDRGIGAREGIEY
ncbi:MAG: cob(I)yrinic acid a,c-diamide adenosyltransferase [bacterium]|nr:cob(I)yrinic acid a,c-diamide adenosyltransferase [bacterium]